MSFFVEFVGQLKRAGSAVGRSAADAAETTKMKLSEIDVESDLENHYRELGRRAYLASKGKLAPKDVEVVISQIDICMDRLADLREKKEEARRKRQRSPYDDAGAQYCEPEDETGADQEKEDDDEA